jgi:hypothetical protein
MFAALAMILVLSGHVSAIGIPYQAAPTLTGEPDFSEWSLLVYEMADNGHIVEIKADGSTTLPMPDCFAPPMNSAYHNWTQNVLAVSPDRRFAAYTFPSPDQVWVAIADSQANICFTAAVPDVIPVNNPRFYLGAFSPDGTAFAFGFGVDTNTLDGVIAMLVTVDLAHTPGQILQTRSFEQTYPLPVAWDDQGIYFLEAALCCEPYPNTGGRLQVWNLAADEIHESDRYAFFGMSIDQLAQTGEIVSAKHDDDFLQDVVDYGAPGNVLAYASQPAESSDLVVIYHNPLDYAVRRVHWVQDGAAVLVQSARYIPPMYYDEPITEEAPARLIFRSGEVKDINLPAYTTFLAGTPDGWLMVLHSEPKRILHAQFIEDELVLTDLNLTTNAYALVVLQAPALGATAPQGFTPSGGVERFRQSNCDSLSQISYLRLMGTGHADGFQPLYAEPDSSGAVLGTFDQFTVLNGPICPDGTFWWLLETNGGVGWATEGSGESPVMRNDCSQPDATHWQVGDQMDFQASGTTEFLLVYSKPFYRDQLGQINPGDSFTVLAGPVCDGASYWWKVDFNGLVGWVNEPLYLG